MGRDHVRAGHCLPVPATDQRGRRNHPRQRAASLVAGLRWGHDVVARLPDRSRAAVPRCRRPRRWRLAAAIWQRRAQSAYPVAAVRDRCRREGGGDHHHQPLRLHRGCRLSGEHVTWVRPGPHPARPVLPGGGGGRGAPEFPAGTGQRAGHHGHPRAGGGWLRHRVRPEGELRQRRARDRHPVHRGTRPAAHDAARRRCDRLPHRCDSVHPGVPEQRAGHCGYLVRRAGRRRCAADPEQHAQRRTEPAADGAEFNQLPARTRPGHRQPRHHHPAHAWPDPVLRSRRADHRPAERPDATAPVAGQADPGHRLPVRPAVLPASPDGLHLADGHAHRGPVPARRVGTRAGWHAGPGLRDQAAGRRHRRAGEPTHGVPRLA